LDAGLDLKMDKDPAGVTADTLTNDSIIQFFKTGIKKITALGLYQWLKGKFDLIYSTFSGAHNDTSGRDAANAHPATSINLDTTNFNNNLSGTDDTVQKAAETLDNMVASGGGGDNDYYDYISAKFTFINFGINI
jgi:hypothetical protein